MAVSERSGPARPSDPGQRTAGEGPASERVLLLLEPGRDRELFAERLDDREVVVGDPDEPLPEFDLCLIDTATYPAAAEALGERKAETGPHLPVLLVLGPDEQEDIARKAADVADDVLPLPTSEPILRSRVESLLRARRGSLQLDAERERFRTLAETAPNAILTIDADGIIQYANPAIEQVFGHSPETVVGEPLTMLMPAGLREAHREGLARYQETGQRSLDWTGSRLPGQHADGHEVPLLLAFAEHRVGGEQRFTGIIQDVTEQVERERELERTVDLLGRTQALADIGGWEIDIETLDVLWTEQVYEILGLPVGEEPSLEEAFELYHPEDQPVIEAAVEDTLETGEAFDLDVRIQRPDGEARWVRVIGDPVTVEGEIEALRGTFQDITERRERQVELERTVDMLDRAESIADVGGWQYDPAADELTWTEQVARIHGLDPEEDAPDVEDAIECYHPDDRPAITEAFERALEEGEPYDLELRIVRPSGEERWVRTIGEPELVDGRRVVRGAFQDIHARKERERELERTVEQLEQTRDIADVSGWGYDPETEAVWWDEKVWDIYDRPESFEPSAEAVLDLYEPRSRERIQAAMERAVVEAEPFDVEIELDTEPPRWVRVTGDPEVEDGRTTGVRGVVRDITGRKRREEFLERHERIVETASEPIYTLDGDLRLTLANSALADLLGREREALMGEHVSSVFDTGHAEALGDAATKLYARDERDPVTIETTVTDDLGRTRRFQTAVSPKMDTEGFHGLVCVSHDVTDVTEHERRLSVLDRVLRHNLRNKMNVVLARAQSIQETAADEAVADAGASIETAAEELLGLGEAARSFHDALDPSQTELLGVEDIAEHAAHVVEAARLSYDDVTIEADLPEAAPATVHAEFELALSELVDNAATHGGPGTTVRVEVETVDDEVVVRVLDDGPGVPTLEQRALEAGWESPLQHATGLGLWFVQWTITNGGGTMSIANRESGGAVVELRLPAGDRDA